MREYIVTLWDIIDLLMLSAAIGVCVTASIISLKEGRKITAFSLWCSAMILSAVIAIIIRFSLTYIAGGG